jgi:hypothetical protein
MKILSCGGAVPESLLIAKSNVELRLLPALANRHGLIAGATGTGNTVTLQRMAGSEMGRQILRGVLGSILGGRRRR